MNAREHLDRSLLPVLVCCALLFAGVGAGAAVGQPDAPPGVPDGQLTLEPMEQSDDGPTPEASPPRRHLAAASPLSFAAQGHTTYGDWHADITLTHSLWRPATKVGTEALLRISDQHLSAMAKAGIKATDLIVLVTAERSFDADGWIRLPSDERMSTLLTPGGLAIEGGIQGAVTNRFGYPFRTPVDLLETIAVSRLRPVAGGLIADFDTIADLPPDLPPGIYRLRFDFGVRAGARTLNLNGYGFAVRPFSDQAGTNCYAYSPPLPASGVHASGRLVDATRIQPRLPWLLLAAYNSNGYRGVIADEDKHRYATSDRSIIPDDVVLPMVDDRGAHVAYSLEPAFATDAIDPEGNIPWDYARGQLSVRITAPDGKATDLGTAPFVEKRGLGPTTRLPAFTAWKPAAYGAYTVTATGWIADAWGRRYEGGGTYRFWIAKRMTMATATFQGMPYPVGGKYGRDIQFNPAVPADVEVTATLYPGSDPAAARSLTYAGKATAAGIFGAAQGMKPFTLDAPGEYHARVFARYTDPEGHLWVCVMRHAGVVYSEDSAVIAHGKKVLIGGQWVDRGETNFEGYVEPDGTNHLAHITFPFQAGDVILIAAEGQAANKIEPVMTYEIKDKPEPWDPKLAGVGVSNLRIKTSNGLSPHLFPEYITDLEYYYGAAPRPGFMSRFIVAESITRAPYWPTSPNAFGGQIGASPNGDTPGDVYRLLGAVVLRRKGEAPQYAGYISSAFILPKGTNNNRIVAPGSEDVIGATGEKARFFLVGLRPGMAYETGALFAPAVQIDPIVPATVRFTLDFPDGRQKIAEGVGDRFGSFVGAEKWTLDVPGVYRYRLEASWDGHAGGMPGLPTGGGEFYVFNKERPAGEAGLRIYLPNQSAFSPTQGLTIEGNSSASSVHLAAITPGAVIEVADLPVSNGRFVYRFDPVAVHEKVPIYDIVSITTGQPQIGRVVHLTFFSKERAGDGTPFWDFARVILRGTTAISTR